MIKKEIMEETERENIKYFETKKFNICLDYLFTTKNYELYFEYPETNSFENYGFYDCIADGLVQFNFLCEDN